MTTKQQERDALAKVRKIVDALGEDSYIATAFTGVFSIADQNIEYDAAFSLAEEAAIAKNDAADAKAEADRLRAENQKLEASATDLWDTLASVREQIVPPWLYKGLWSFISGEHDAAKEQMAQVAETMAELADEPRDIAFEQAVKSFRRLKERRECCEQMLTGLESIEPKNL